MRMRFPYRQTKAARGAADGPAGWHGPPRLADHACCCPAMPVVRVLIPPASERTHPVDLLLCGHHYLASRAALAAADAVVIDETGAVWNQTRRALKHAALRPPAADAWLRCMMTWPVTHLISGSGGLWSSRPFGGPSDHGRERGASAGRPVTACGRASVSSHQEDGTRPRTRWTGTRPRAEVYGPGPAHSGIDSQTGSAAMDAHCPDGRRSAGRTRRSSRWVSGDV